MTPNEISEASACFACIEDKAAARLYLLGRIAAITDPTVIASDSAGFDLPIPDQVLALVLLAQMAGFTNLDEIISGSAGYRGLNERAAALYLAEVIASNGTGAVGGLVWGPAINRIGNISMNFGDTTTVTISSSVQFIDGGLDLSTFSLLESVILDALESIGQGDLYLADNVSLNRASFALLTSLGTGNINCNNSALLSDFNIPVFMPRDGMSISLFNCALNAAAVNQVLARCVAGGVTTCNIDLSGGTSATPTGQGITDKADLITAGNTVNTN